MNGNGNTQQSAWDPEGKYMANGTTGNGVGAAAASGLAMVKNASLGASVGGGLLMLGGGVLFLKTIRATPKQQRDPAKTLMRTASVLMIAGGAAMATTSGAIFAGTKAIESRPAVKMLVG